MWGVLLESLLLEGLSWICLIAILYSALQINCKVCFYLAAADTSFGGSLLVLLKLWKRQGL